MHVYEWLENFNKEECKDEALLKLWEFLDFRTRDTMWQWKNKHLKPTYKLFCKFKDKKYKINGASRLGDMWLSKDYNSTEGYDLRVDISDCRNFTFKDK